MLISEVKRLSGKVLVHHCDLLGQNNLIGLLIIFGSLGGGDAIKFGILFEATQESMPALAATLNVAKKRGVVHYDGVMLMQGSDDDTIIKLLRDEIEDSPVFESVRIAATSPSAGQQGPTACPCHVCSKIVYPTERLAANDKVHRYY
jgi:hypothetical protein